jgi:hypothetical protein
MLSGSGSTQGTARTGPGRGRPWRRRVIVADAGDRNGSRRWRTRRPGVGEAARPRPQRGMLIVVPKPTTVKERPAGGDW